MVIRPSFCFVAGLENTEFFGVELGVFVGVHAVAA
jgi:hypothetical protein